MSKLSDFLHPVTGGEEKEVIVSRRFVKRDDAGNPILDDSGKMIPKPFRIRAIPQEENEALVKAATMPFRNRNGQMENRFDKIRYSRSLVVAATVEPDFRSTEMCQAYGTLDPLEVPGKMLLAGEYQALSDAIAEHSCIGADFEEEAKN